MRADHPWFFTSYEGEELDDLVWRQFKLQRRIIERAL